jgi:hypothetical protein
MKVVPNHLIYHQKKFQNFLTPLAIFQPLLPNLCLRKRVKEKFKSISGPDPLTQRDYPHAHAGPLVKSPLPHAWPIC